LECPKTQPGSSNKVNAIRVREKSIDQPIAGSAHTCCSIDKFGDEAFIALFKTTSGQQGRQHDVGKCSVALDPKQRVGSELSCCDTSSVSGIPWSCGL
jgi:hypothetical protein